MLPSPEGRRDGILVQRYAPREDRGRQAQTPYNSKPRRSYIIYSDDVTKIRGDVAWSAGFKKRIDELQRNLTHVSWLLNILVTIGAGILANVIYDSYAAEREQAAAAVQVQEARTASPAPLPKQETDKPTAATKAPALATQPPPAEVTKAEPKQTEAEPKPGSDQS